VLRSGLPWKRVKSVGEHRRSRSNGRCMIGCRSKS
jgi:hypothetical protein